MNGIGQFRIVQRLFSAAVGAALLVPSSAALAQTQEETVYEMGETSVIATRTPKDRLDAPGSVSIISERKIQALLAEHPFKPLARTEGVWPRQYRGLADYWARPVFRGQRALVLVDGVNWYDYGYYYHTGAIPMPDVKSIDIVRGPFSGLYGTAAQTAVINYITKIPEATEARAEVSYGDWGSRNYSFRFADRPAWEGSPLDGRLFYSVSLKSRSSDGYVTTPTYKSLSGAVDGALDAAIPVVSGWQKDIDPQTGKDRYRIGHQGENWYEDYGLFIKTGYDFSPDTRLWYSLNTSKFKYGWRGGRSFLADGSGNILYEGPVYIQDAGSTYATTLTPFLFTSDPRTKQSVVHTLHFDHSTRGSLNIAGLLAYNGKESTTQYVSRSRYKVEDNHLAQADLTATYVAGSRWLLTAGFQGIQETATVTDKNLSDRYDKGSILSVREKTTGKNRTLGSFLQAEFAPVNYVTLYMGGRYDRWWGYDAAYTNIDGIDIDHPDTDDGRFSPKVSLVYRPSDRGSVRASYGGAFTAPSLYYRTATYYWEGGGSISRADPNPNLQPTTNDSWEIGTEWESWERRIHWKATYFNTHFEDLIVNQSTTTTLDDGTQLIQKQRVNAEEAEVQGLEASIEAAMPLDLRAGLYLTHNWSKYTKTQADSKRGWEMEETPTDMWSVWLGRLGHRLDSSFSLRYSDRRYDDEKTPYADTTYKGDDEYYIADAKVTFRPVPRLAISLAVDNLFDQKYYEYYRAPGRYWQLSQSLSFD